MAISMIKKTHFDLLLCDIRLGDITGLDVLKALKDQNPDTVVIMISAYATTEAAVEAMNEGAYDFVPKPFDNEELKQTIENALDLKTIEHEKEILDDELKRTLHFGKIVGNSPSMKNIYQPCPPGGQNQNKYSHYRRKWNRQRIDRKSHS